MATYQVKRQDTWAKIAQQTYGDGARAAALQRANPGVSVLHQGISLNLPPPPVTQASYGGGGGGYSPYGPSFAYYGGYIPRYASRPPTYAPRPPASTPYTGYPSYLASYFQRAAGYYRPPYTPTPAPRPGGTPTPVPRSTPRPSPQAYTPLNFPVWLPQQASMTPGQWSGRPPVQPSPQAAPRPGMTGAPRAGASQYPPGAFLPGNWPYLPQQAYMTPEMYTGIPPQQYGLFAMTTPEGQGSRGYAYGGWGGWGGGGGAGQARKQGTLTLLPERGPSWNWGPSPTGRQVNLENASLGYIHWRI